MANELQTANVMVALGGNRHESVPKYGVTAAEIAVLRLIHGEQSVYEIDITGSVTRTHRQEIGRLTETYGRQDGERRVAPAVAELFPGAAARVFETFEELELPDEFFVAEGRRTAAAKPAPKAEAPAPVEDADDGLDKMTVKDLQAHADKLGVDLTGVTKKADIVEAIRAHQAAGADAQDDAGGQDADDDNDGVGDMPDKSNIYG